MKLEISNETLTAFAEYFSNLILDHTTVKVLKSKHAFQIMKHDKAILSCKFKVIKYNDRTYFGLDIKPNYELASLGCYPRFASKCPFINEIVELFWKEDKEWHEPDGDPDLQGVSRARLSSKSSDWDKLFRDDLEDKWSNGLMRADINYIYYQSILAFEGDKEVVFVNEDEAKIDYGYDYVLMDKAGLSKLTKYGLTKLEKKREKKRSNQS